MFCLFHLFIVSFCIYYFSLYICNLWKYSNFSGPMPLPIIGNLYNVKNFSFINLINRLSKKYGDVYKFFIFSKPFIVVSKPNLTKYILLNNDIFYKDDAFYKDGLGIIFGQGLVTSNGEKHKNDKKIFHKYFMNPNINKHMELINNIAKKNINDLIDVIDVENKKINIEHFFAKITIQVILKYGFDVEMESQEENITCHYISNASYLSVICGCLDIPRWNIIPIINKLNYYKDYFEKTLIKIIDNHNKKIESDDHNKKLESDNILTHMLKENMSLNDMTDHFITILSAGQDTTSYLMSYMAYLLSHDQDIQEKVREEFNLKEFDSSFPYFDMVINETLRLYPVIPQISRTCNEDIFIKEENITIPKYSTIIIPFYISNRDPNIWENPKQFNPDRFKERGNLLKKGYFPFCYGQRTCIGNHLANIETKIVMYNLIKKYKILPVPYFKPNILAGISLTTQNGIDVILEKI